MRFLYSLPQVLQSVSKTTVLSVLGSVASLVGLVIVLFPSDDTTTPSSPSLVTVPVSASEPERLDIEGAWHSGIAQTIVVDSLEVAGDALCEEPCTHHEILGEYFLRHRSGDAVIVVAASTFETNTCNACALPLSFFEFRKRARGWRLESVELGTMSWGTHGEVSPEMVNVYAIGDDTYGVFLELSGIQMGESVAVTSIHARVLDTFREILSLQTAYDNSRAMFTEEGEETIWTAEIDIEERETGFFDLAVTRRGIEEGMPFEETRVYKFNGRQYVPSETIR